MQAHGNAQSEVVGARDWAVVAGQLGRAPYELTGIAMRCPYGYPVLIESPPLVRGQVPNPNLLYLSCPSLKKAVSRAEARGAVKELRFSFNSDPGLRAVLLQVNRLYQERRITLAEALGREAESSGVLVEGIGGPADPGMATCLHAYAAAFLAVMSGWLREGRATGGLGGEQASPADLVAKVQQVWERFLPPLGECWCLDARCAQWENVARRAAIDVGTISVRLLVADTAEGRLRTVIRQVEVTRLGEGLKYGARLGEAPKRRTTEAVERYAAVARAAGADSVVLAGTSATRDALDGEKFITRLALENGLTAAVLSGQREAELAFAGVRSDLQGDLVVIDIGGGSTEVIWAGEGGKVEAVSLDLGASRATERWIRSDPPAPEEIRAVYEEAKAAFAGVPDLDRRALKGRRLVGTAGTVTTLAALDAGLEKYDPELVHHRVLGLESVRRLVKFLAGLTCEEREALPSVQPGRAAVIPGGAAILLAAMETLGYERLTVSERDLLDGLVLCGL